MSEEKTRTKPESKSVLWALILAVLAAHYVFIAMTWDTGYVKDEGYYFSASRDNFGWYKSLVNNTLEGDPFKAFTAKEVRRYWANNAEHPPFCKTMQGLNHMLWYDWFKTHNFGNSHRMSTWVFTAIMIVFMILLARQWMGVGYSIFAVAFLFSLPRVFFHTHLSTFDIPVVAMWFIIAYAFRKGMGSRGWALLTGVLLGVGLATKNNAYFLPVLFFILYMASDYRRLFFSSLASIPKTLKAADKRKIALLVALVLFPIFGSVLSETAFNATLLLSIIAANLWLGIELLRKKPTIPKHIAIILPQVFTAPFVFFLLWPWIWFDTWQRLGAYFHRHLHPPAWETYYLGDIIMNPPPFAWHYPFVMSFYTIPATAIFLMLFGFLLLLFSGKSVGALRALAAKMKGQAHSVKNHLLDEASAEAVDKNVITPHWDKLFLLWNILLPYLIIANPKTPIYGGTKHFMTAMPFLAIVATLALRWLVNRFALRFPMPKAGKLGFAGFLMVLATTGGAIGIYHTHPNTLSYYNELMGGTIAAPEVGMQRTFWAASTRETLPFINEHAPKRARIWFNNTPWDSFNAYKKDGLLRGDLLRAHRMEQADIAVMNHWKYYIDGAYEIRRIFNAPYAEHASHIDGLPLTEVYFNKWKQIRLNPPKQ